jgi:2-dehydro-3-deoxyphosphooctonate aldolase (KDO 8-P synthase)
MSEPSFSSSMSEPSIPWVKGSESLLYKELRDAEPFFVFAGPCVIESEEHAMMMSGRLQEIGRNVGVPLVYKSSFDKANRTSNASHRGPGMLEGCQILSRVRADRQMPIVTDIHESNQAAIVAEHVDVLQIPAFLCRQTDLLIAAGETGKIVNIKKGQFCGPETMLHAAKKVRDTGNPNVFLCERGSTFGYTDLIVDFRNLVAMRAGAPVVQDVTHAVQQPGGLGNSTGGLRQYVPTIARAAVAVGVTGLFFEVHDDPKNAFSDGPNCWPLQHFEELLFELKAIAAVTKGRENKIPQV